MAAKPPGKKSVKAGAGRISRGLGCIVRPQRKMAGSVRASAQGEARNSLGGGVHTAVPDLNDNYAPPDV